MGSIYYADVLDVLRDAGCEVVESSTTDGWEQRSRSSGGFDAPPLGVVWHHTASSTTPENDLDYMINVSPDAPVGNLHLDRDGVYRPVAAGCANTQGKGGPSLFSRGTVPVDKGNTMLWAIEIACDGVGGQYSQATIDAAFRGSNALNAHFGNRPNDVITHALGAGDGYTSRKIDPATAAAVQGAWRPASTNSSGTWLLTDLKNECVRRAGSEPAPIPIPIPEDDMSNVLILEDVRNGAWYRCGAESKSWIRDGHMSAQVIARLEETAAGGVAIDGFRYTKVTNGNVDFVRSTGPIVGPAPAGVDEYGG